MKHWIIGICTSVLLLLNTIIGMIPMLLLALIKLLVPLTPVRTACFEAVRWIASTWASINGIIFRSLTPTRWEVRGDQSLRKNESLLVISNHQTWVDIPALMAAIHGKAPFFTFFLKKELIWVPFLGLAWWALEYPFMRRYTKQQLEQNPDLRGKDLEITKKACDRLRGRAVTLVNYLEGTRFTPAKQAQQASPYRHLLKPKSGGVAFTLSAMGDQLSQLLDVTLVYPGDSAPSFWDFLSGRIAWVIIDLEKLPIPQAMTQGDYQQDPAFRAAFQTWINQLWQHKDEKIARLRQQGLEST